MIRAWGAGLIGCAAAAALALSGCAASSGPTMVHDDNRIAVVGAPQTSSGDAAISGTLALDGEQCWVIANAIGDFRPVIWPAGTIISGGTIQLPGHHPEKAGTAVSGGGGGGTAPATFSPCMNQGDQVTYLDTVDKG